MANPHPGDALTQDVLDYVESASDDLVADLLGGPLAPQAATMTEAEKTRYFAHQFWNPDGSPNQAGRDALQTKYGVQGFARIAKSLATRHGQLSADVGDLPEEA